MNPTPSGAISGFSDAEKISDTDEFLSAALRAVRRHLGMDIAFVSEIRDGRRYFRSVDAATGETRISVGNSDPVDEGYCQRVVDGRLPELIIDASACATAAAMPVTRKFPIGSHLSVPIRLADGSVYGTFCCFSYAPDPSINVRDLQTVRTLAELAAHRIADDKRNEAVRREKLARVSQLFMQGVGSLVYQPIFRLMPLQLVGFECLSRFAAEPRQPPDKWFEEAAEVGLGVELELRAVELAMHSLELLPDRSDLAVNLSPAAVLSGKLPSVLASGKPERVVLEVTEHAAIEDYDEFATALAPLRAAGVRLAIDDVGAGFASMRHILRLRPDVIKLDLSLTRNIDADESQAALTAALVTFSEKTGCELLAEGIETEPELERLRRLGVQFGQGYLLGRPQPDPLPVSGG